MRCRAPAKLRLICSGRYFSMSCRDNNICQSLVGRSDYLLRSWVLAQATSGPDRQVDLGFSMEDHGELSDPFFVIEEEEGECQPGTFTGIIIS